MSATTTERPTIFDFTAGTPYSVSAVAMFFGVSTETVRKWIRGGKLKAKRPKVFGTKQGNASPYYIDGAEVRRVYGCELLADDVRRAQPESDAELHKRAAATLARLERSQKREQSQTTGAST